MKTYRLNDIDLLIAELYSHPHDMVVIDGEDGVGKSNRIAPRIANALGSVIIHLDDYLRFPSDTYALDLEKLTADIATLKKVDPIVIEGVMAVKPLEQIGCSPFVHVYVEGNMCRKTWTNPHSIHNQKSFQEILLHEEQEILRLSPESRLTTFRKEIIEYHYRYRPFENADYKLVVE